MISNNPLGNKVGADIYKLAQKLEPEQKEQFLTDVSDPKLSAPNLASKLKPLYDVASDKQSKVLDKLVTQLTDGTLKNDFKVAFQEGISTEKAKEVSTLSIATAVPVKETEPRDVISIMAPGNSGREMAKATIKSGLLDGIDKDMKQQFVNAFNGNDGESFAADQGKNGIKSLKGHKDYAFEVKINDGTRLYAKHSDVTQGPPLSINFTVVGKHT